MTTLTRSTGTVALTGAAEKVTLPAVYGWVWVKNMSDSDIFAGLSADISKGADGVLTIAAGEAGRIQVDGREVYLLGSGNVQIAAQNYADCPFKTGAKGGVIVGDNLLINPDFKVNQRGISGTFSETGKYFVDRWQLTSGTVTVNADGSLTLNGTISQKLENAVGENVTASASAGAAVYDNIAKTFTLTGNGDIILWAKLEYGKKATPFVAPNPVSELQKCQRYYEVLKTAFATGYFHSATNAICVAYFNPKRAKPTITIEGDLLIWVNGYVSSNGIAVKSAEISAYYPNSMNCRIGFAVESGGIANAPCVAEMRNGKGFILDAEIY